LLVSLQESIWLLLAAAVAVTTLVAVAVLAVF
jgi:hypothetical protein